MEIGNIVKFWCCLFIKIQFFCFFLSLDNFCIPYNFQPTKSLHRQSGKRFNLVRKSTLAFQNLDRAEHKKNTVSLNLLERYSLSYNLIPPISQVLSGRHLIFCSLTLPTCCNSSRKCTPVKYKAGQKAGFPIVT